MHLSYVFCINDNKEIFEPYSSATLVVFVFNADMFVVPKNDDANFLKMSRHLKKMS